MVGILEGWWVGERERCREDFRQWCENHIRHTKSSVNHINNNREYTNSK